MEFSRLTEDDDFAGLGPSAVTKSPNGGLLHGGRRMSGLLRAVRKSLRIPKLEDHVRTFHENDLGSEKSRMAVFGIRECAEQKKTPGELVDLGVIGIMIKVLVASDSEGQLWALWVLRYLAQYEEAANLIFQEPNAVTGLVNAITASNPGSEIALRSIECIKNLSQHPSLRKRLARKDVSDAMHMALNSPNIIEASSAMYVIYNLCDQRSGNAPGYIPEWATTEVLANIKALSHHPRLTVEDREIAGRLYDHLAM